MKKNKILGLSLAGLLLLSTPALANDSDMKPISAPADTYQEQGQVVSGGEMVIPSHYAPIRGTVKEIKDHPTITDGKFITIDSDNSGINHIILTPDTQIKDEAEITVGTQLITYYDTKAPMILIYPPQYKAKLAIVVDDWSELDVSKMDLVVNQEAINAPAAYTNAEGTVMVPLRAISEALGHKVDLVGDTVYIGFTSSLIIGKDYYTFAKMAPIELGTAPELINQDTTFVPLSYFKKVLRVKNVHVSENQIVINNDEIVTEIGESTKFNQEELKAAIKAVKNDFNFPASTLTKIWYDEEVSNKQVKSYLENGKGQESDIKPENVIVLLSNFDVDDSGDNPVLNPNSTYEDYLWILIRENQTSPWEIDDWGY